MAWINADQLARDLGGLRNVCAACGSRETSRDPLVLSDDGYRVHHSHVTDPRSGLYGHGQR